MAKEKLFAPEDFDKEPRNTKKKNIKWIAISIVIIAVVAIVWGVNEWQSGHLLQSSTHLSNPIVLQNNIDSINSVSQDGSLQSTEVQNVLPNKVIQGTEKEEVHQLTNSMPMSSTLEDKTITNVETQALKVIRGEYGNNPQRKSILGKDYSVIQNKVNELKRKGVF